MVNLQDELLIQKFCIINQQRFFIEEKLNELGLKSNWELQRIYIDECRRKNFFYMNEQLRKTFQAKINNPKKKYNNKITPIIKLRNGKRIKIRNNPWRIKSPLTRKINIKKIQIINI
jgi:hypothetical protein